MDNCLNWSMYDGDKVYKKCPQVYELEAELVNYKTALDNGMADALNAAIENAQLKAELADAKQDLEQGGINFTFLFNHMKAMHDVLDLPADTWQNEMVALAGKVKQLQAELTIKNNYIFGVKKALEECMQYVSWKGYVMQTKKHEYERALKEEG